MEAAVVSLPRAAVVTADVLWIFSISDTISVVSTAIATADASAEIARFNIPIYNNFLIVL